jgi:hypothetical protein
MSELKDYDYNKEYIVVQISEDVMICFLAWCTGLALSPVRTTRIQKAPKCTNNGYQ